MRRADSSDSNRNVGSHHCPPAPLDILAQQIVAAAATQTWTEEELFALVRRAFPYQGLERSDVRQVVHMLADGIATIGDEGWPIFTMIAINHELKGRRGARLAAITSGGAIPDTANYAVGGGAGRHRRRVGR